MSRDLICHLCIYFAYVTPCMPLALEGYSYRWVVGKQPASPTGQQATSVSSQHAQMASWPLQECSGGRHSLSSHFKHPTSKIVECSVPHPSGMWRSGVQVLPKPRCWDYHRAPPNFQDIGVLSYKVQGVATEYFGSFIQHICI